MRARTWLAFGSLRCRIRCVRRQNSHTFGARGHSASRRHPPENSETSVGHPGRGESARTVAHSLTSPILHTPVTRRQSLALCALPHQPRQASAAARMCFSLSASASARLQPAGCRPPLGASSKASDAIRRGGEQLCIPAAQRGPCMPCRSSNCAHTACAPTYDRPRCRSPLLWTHA